MQSKKGKCHAAVRQWTAAGLLGEFTRINETMENRAFAFIIGAGASVSSGVPCGHTLAVRWIEELYRQEVDEKPKISLTEWATEENLAIPGFDLREAGTFYPEVYERRFSADPDSGYAYLEAEMLGAEPGVGYSVLAQVLARTRHRVIITTNFDNMVKDALAIYTEQRPLVCAHEALTALVPRKLRRPLIAKIHRDILLAPFCTPTSTSQLESSWRPILRDLLAEYTPIVLGYGGNDGSLMGLLEELDTGHIPGGIYWCFRPQDGIPSLRVRKLLSKRRFRVFSG